MARQNVGTPRFYVDILQWLKSQGALSPVSSQWEEDNLLDLIGINPSESKQLIPSSENNNTNIDDTFVYETNAPFKKLMPNNKNFFMVLGHNLASAKASIYTHEQDSSSDSVATSGLINYSSDSVTENDGFSISIGNDAHDVDTVGISFRLDAIEEAYSDNIKIGSVLYGSYYDMPHSPDLNLKLRYEYDGVKTIQTKSGATISNALYTKPADWGSQGAWQLGGKQNYRTGRRTWDLSFSYLSADGIMPLNAGNSQYSTSEESGLFTSNILDGTDFFSQVWNRTIGGALPFIFQPDNNNNNPDQFAICKFAQNSLNYEQVAPNVYNIKLKIEEVW